MESLRSPQSSQPWSNHPDNKASASQQVLKSWGCLATIEEFLGPKETVQIAALAKVAYPRAKDLLRKYELSLFDGIKVRGCDVRIQKEEYEYDNGADVMVRITDRQMRLWEKGKSPCRQDA